MKKERKSGTSIKATLHLKEKQYITPHFIRAIFTSEDLSRFSETTVGTNNKIFIPPAGVQDIHFPEYDYKAGKWILPPVEVCPAIRTYTHRGINLDKNELVMDFVAHGESGLASAWILNAKAGDKIGVSMWNAAIELYPVADWYLLAGDATGIPVLSVILETLPATAKGVVIIEVHGPEDEQELHTRADIEMRWLYNASPENGSNLAAEVRSIHIPSVESSTRFGYVAAEFSSVKGIREYLRKEQAWKREELYAYSYWKAGVSEDGSGKDRDAEYAGDR